MNIKSKAKAIAKETPILRQFLYYWIYSSQFKRYLKKLHFENKKIEGEEAYKQKWKVFSPLVEPYSYRLFGNYCGFTPNIIPEDIVHSYIEEVLNPTPFRSVYADKNLFPEIVGKEHTPRTVVCRINGSQVLDAEYCYADMDLSKYIGTAKSLILKPTIDSCSGQGIIKFIKKDGVFVSTDGEINLTEDFLYSYNKNFCLQETVSQHEFMNKLCPTSVNTIRLCVYRSVKDEKSHVTASFIRIGKNGAFLDNAHAGGMIIGVNAKTGEMGKYVVDQYGNKENVWNEINFSENSFIVPCWKEIIAFAEYVGRRVYHHRLLALDIALKEDEKPILIEYNLEKFAPWPFMFTGQEAFGEYTDEIIKFCVANTGK